MAKIIKRVIAILLAVTATILLVLPADTVSATYTKGDYVLDGGTLVSYTGDESEITIPLGVTKIGKDCFSGNNRLTTVHIPDDITEIDYAAFENCKNLKKVDISKNIKSIGSSAFSGCQSLSDFTIPAKVETLGSGVFAACPNLATVNIAADNENFICLDGVIYSKDGKKMYQYLAGRPYSTYEIPQPVTEIGEFGFYGANMLTTVTIAQGVKEIPEYAFLNCTALSKVNIPNTVEAIRRGAFGGCTNLKALDVPTTVSYIDENAFTSLDGVKGDVVNSSTGEVLSESNSDTVNAENTAADNQQAAEEGQNSTDNTVAGNADVNDASFTNMSANSPYTYTEGELASTYIVGGEAVFLADPKAMIVKGFDVEAAQTEDSIAESANTSAVGEDVRSYSGKEFDVVGGTLGHYEGAGGTVVIPSDTGKIGNRVFYGNNTITEAVIPATVNEIGDFAFARSSLETVEIPESVTKIGYAAFYNCENLKNISIPSTVKEIELSAFDGSGFINNWRDVEDGNNFLILGDGILVAYKGYKQDIEIPESVKTIGPGVFQGNERIRSVTMPVSVTKICEDAFNGCTGIETLSLPGNIHVIEDRAFKNTSLKSITIPPNCESIGLGAFDTVAVNGGLESVTFKGTILPDCTYKPTASRLSAGNLRTNSFNGTKVAFVQLTADVASAGIFDPHKNGFRGSVFSIGNELEKRVYDMRLRKCILEPDETGLVEVDGDFRLDRIKYILSSVTDTAFNEYVNADWCNNPVTNIEVDGENSEALTELISGINDKIGSEGNASDGPLININDNGLSKSGRLVSAEIPNNTEEFNLNIRRDDSLTSEFTRALDDRYGSHAGVLMDTYSIDMTDRLNTIPIKKMATNKLEIKMPLPEMFNESEDVRVVAIDDNGLLEDVACHVTDVAENEKMIDFVASHLSPYAIIVMGDEESLTVVTDSVSVGEESADEAQAAPIVSNSIVYGTLTKDVAGIPARYIVSIILFSMSALFIIWSIRKKTI